MFVKFYLGPVSNCIIWLIGLALIAVNKPGLHWLLVLAPLPFWICVMMTYVLLPISMIINKSIMVKIP